MNRVAQYFKKNRDEVFPVAVVLVGALTLIGCWVVKLIL